MLRFRGVRHLGRKIITGTVCCPSKLVTIRNTETSFVIIRSKKRLFRLFCFYIETQSFGVSVILQRTKTSQLKKNNLLKITAAYSASERVSTNSLWCPRGICSSAACSALGRVSSTAVSGALGYIYSTAAALPTDMSVLQQTPLLGRIFS
jgi:hypothetical protein